MYRPSKLYPPYWNRLRHKVFQRDNYICQKCGRKCDRVTKSRRPHCHHIKSIKAGGLHIMRNLETLCEECHKKEHGR